MTDPISDLLTRIRNGLRAKLPTITLPHSRIKENIVNVLKAEGYIIGFDVEGKVPKTMTLKLKYDGRRAVIEGVRRVSRPGLRTYVGAGELPRVRGGLGVAILSTSRGVMTATQARKQNLGGEIICHVW